MAFSFVITLAGQLLVVLVLVLVAFGIVFDTPKPKPEPQPETIRIGKSLDRIEFDRVVHVLRSQYDNLEPGGDVALHNHEAVILAFTRMVSKVQRQAYPDPEARYTDMIAHFKANREQQPRPSPLPRYRILTLMKVHLGAILGEPCM